MLCPRCQYTMKTKMHFESSKQYQFHECPNCYERTKNKRIHFDDVSEENQKLIKIKMKGGDNH